MTRRLLAPALALTLAAACSAPHPEPPMPPSETTDPGHPPGPWPTDTESQIVREILAVSAVVKRYLKAVTTKNEAEAAKLTCDRTSPGLLWISSMGRPITLLAVTGVILESMDGPSAWTKIHVDGKPESPLTLKQVKGEWCVWP